MKRSERLDVVQQVAARTERERAERVGAAERHLVEMQQKLTALEKYRSEYENGFATRAGAGLDVIGMRDFRPSGPPRRAMAQQRELVAQAQKR
jgi:flagellar biosynthesis chaperone FliJ